MIYFPDNDKSKMYTTEFQDGGYTYSISPGEGYSTTGGDTYKMGKSGNLMQTDTDFGGSTSKLGGMMSGGAGMGGGMGNIAEEMHKHRKQLFSEGSAEGEQSMEKGVSSGVIGGAKAGFQIGGPWGALIGGAVGGVAGAVGTKKNIRARKKLEDVVFDEKMALEGQQGVTESEKRKLLSQKYLAEKPGTKAKYGMKTSNMYQQGGSLNNPRLLEYAPNFKFKSGGQTKGAYNHKTNPLKVIDKYGNDTGMELTGGEGVYDKVAQKNMENAIKNKDYAKAGMIVENEVKDWKRRGMYK